MSTFPATRLRRLRRTGALRSLVRETELNPADVVMPLFVAPEPFSNEALLAASVPLLRIAPPPDAAELPVKLAPGLTVRSAPNSLSIAPPAAAMLFANVVWVTVAVA